MSSIYPVEGIQTSEIKTAVTVNRFLLCVDSSPLGSATCSPYPIKKREIPQTGCGRLPRMKEGAGRRPILRDSTFYKPIQFRPRF